VKEDEQLNLISKYQGNSEEMESMWQMWL